jgi:hypothetical protein
MAHAQTGGEFALCQAGPLAQGQRPVGKVEVADLVVIDGRALQRATFPPHLRCAE